MTDRQKAIQDLLIRLQTNPFVTSQGLVNGYRISAIVVQLRKLGHHIQAVQVKAKRINPTGFQQFYVPNCYIKYTYINGPKQKED